MVEKISGEYNTYPTDVAERAWGGVVDPCKFPAHCDTL